MRSSLPHSDRRGQPSISRTPDNQSITAENVSDTAVLPTAGKEKLKFHPSRGWKKSSKLRFLAAASHSQMIDRDTDEDAASPKTVRLARREGMEFNRFGFVQRLVQEAIALRKKKRSLPAKG
jgi:hypothetical protein